MLDEKKCTKCEVIKPITEFYRRKNARDGLKSWCKACEIDGVISRRKKDHNKFLEYCKNWHKDNKEQSLEVSRRWKKENKDRANELSRNWYNDNKKKCLDYARLWREENLEMAREKVRKWFKENPQKNREYVRRRHALEKKATVGVVSYENILARDGYICHICGGVVAPNDLHFDHIFPLSRGGEHTEKNIAVSHSKCNLRKNNKTMEEYLNGLRSV